MTECKTTPIDDLPEREILVSCLLHAPREVVFNAWTDPEILPLWWGPDGFTNTVQQIDIRPGGTWRFTMHGPDGTEYKNELMFDDIITPSRITYTRKTGPLFQGVATFDEEGGNKTLLTMRMIFDSPELRDRVANEFGAVEGAKQTLARLEAIVTRPSQNN